MEIILVISSLKNVSDNKLLTKSNVDLVLFSLSIQIGFKFFFSSLEVEWVYPFIIPNEGNTIHKQNHS